MAGKKLLLTKEAASILRISEEYLRLLIRQKRINAYKEGRRGGYRIPAGEIDDYIQNRYKNEKKLDQAVEEFRKVLAAYPDNYNTYMHLAEIRDFQGRYRLAIYNLKKAMAYNPGWGKAHKMLAGIYTKDGQYQNALKELQDAGVVVLWRPLPEMNGEWYWWGKTSHPSNAEPYVNIFRDMYDYFTNVKGLNNLIWVYSPAHEDKPWSNSVFWAYPDTSQEFLPHG